MAFGDLPKKGKKRKYSKVEKALRLKHFKMLRSKGWSRRDAVKILGQ